MLQKRAAALGGVMLLLLLGLVAALAVLIFGRGAQLSAAAWEQRLRSLPYCQYARGDILDRNGRPLVNVEEPCLVVLPAMIKGQEEPIAERLCGLLDLDRSRLAERLRAAGTSSFQPVVLMTGLSAAQKEAVDRAAIPGVLTLSLAARYDRQHTASQLIGLVQEQEGNGVYTGVSGLEKQYDGLLSARVDAEIRLQVDAQGRVNGGPELYLPDTVCAPSLSLTLDKDYQQIAEQALAETGLSGSCVVMDPYCGDILALASYPGFDPYGWKTAEPGAYMQRTLLPYPPASTFKTVLAAAALAEGVRPAPAETAAGPGQEDANDGQAEQGKGDGNPALFICHGSYTLPDGRTVSCAGGAAHGEVDLARALALSCNCYFVALGQALGGERVLAYSRRLGLEQMTVIGLDAGSGDAVFFDFDPEQAGELANVCLGEDGVSLSPLQEAVLFSAFVNGGYLVRPRLVTATDDGKGGRKEYPALKPRRVLSPADAETMRLMLGLVVEEGTGRSAGSDIVSSGGKTGSSETGVVWFSGFFPADRPRLVVAVCLEQGSSGGAEAAAVFRSVAEAITLLDGRI